jgi:type II secretory pathway pseudopilin PulG
VTARTLRTRLAAEDGFTLSELLVATILLGIVFATFALLASAVIRHGSRVTEEDQLQLEARAFVNSLAWDLRQAYTGDGTSPVESLGATRIQFLSAGGGTPFHLRRISYRVTGTRLERAVAQSANTGGPPWTMPALSTYSRVISPVVNATVFTFYDANGAVTATPSAVRRVAFTLTLAPPQSKGRRLTYSGSVTLRVTQ